MKFVTPGMHWHTQEPVLSVDFHRTEEMLRVASGGADSEIGIWELYKGADNKLAVQVLSRLLRHTSAVNVVRFSPSGEFLASAGDDRLVMLWTRDLNFAGGQMPYHDSNLDIKEQWRVVKVLRGHLGDIYDLCWSKDSRFIISGSVDNCAIVWGVQSDHPLQCRLEEAHHYIQGVCWDPRGEFAVTLSSDRAMRVYKSSGKYRCVHSVKTFSVQAGGTAGKVEGKHFRMFVDETMTTFFRRLVFSPDGAILVAPAGCFEVDAKTVNTTFVFARNNLTKPIAHLPGILKPSIAVSFCPLLFQLRETNSPNTPKCSAIQLPYRMVFAVATVTSVLLYDTQHLQPIALVENIHCEALTDLSWSHDGKVLAVSSMDNFCTFLEFAQGELGEEYVQDKAAEPSQGVFFTPNTFAARSPVCTASSPLTTPSHDRKPLHNARASNTTPVRPVAARSGTLPSTPQTLLGVSIPASTSVTPVTAQPAARHATPSEPTPVCPPTTTTPPDAAVNTPTAGRIDEPIVIDCNPPVDQKKPCVIKLTQSQLIISPECNNENASEEPMAVDCNAKKLDTGPVKPTGSQSCKQPRRIALTTLTKF